MIPRRSFLSIFAGACAALSLKLKGPKWKSYPFPDFLREPAKCGRDFEVSIYTRHYADGLWYHRAVLITGNEKTPLAQRRWLAVQSGLFRDDGASQMQEIKEMAQMCVERELKRPVSMAGMQYFGREANTVFVGQGSVVKYGYASEPVNPDAGIAVIHQKLCS